MQVQAAQLEKRCYLHPHELLFAITFFLLLYTHQPFGHAHSLSFTLWFFIINSGEKTKTHLQKRSYLQVSAYEGAAPLSAYPSALA